MNIKDFIKKYRWGQPDVDVDMEKDLLELVFSEVKSFRDKHIDAFNKSLTKDELDAPTYFDWSDETLGRCTRTIMEGLKMTDVEGFKGVNTMAAVYLLILTAVEMNATELKQTLQGHSIRGNKTGDWEIIVRKVTPKKKKSEKRKV